MRYLVDTSTLLWYLASDKTLSAENRALIDEPTNIAFVSVATLWELAIKFNIGKLASPYTFDEIVDVYLSRYNFTMLAIHVSHLKRYRTLPLHHRDPFDRLLIAQSLVEGIPVITSDAAFDRYAIQRVW